MPIRHENGRKADPSLFAQDDAGAIFRIATQFPAGQDKGGGLNDWKSRTGGKSSKPELSLGLFFTKPCRT
jgi:hypothetical protein